MDTENIIERVRVLKENTDILSFVRDVANTSDQEKSFIVYDIGEVVRRYNEWVTAMPRITPFYAVKVNDNDTIIKTLTALGAGFDCSSKHEIDKVLKFGVTTDRIIFSHTTKLISYVHYAATVNVHLMTFDNEHELYKIKKYYPDSKLVLRFRCDDPTAVVSLGMKFGCNHKTEAPELLKIARYLDLNVIGVSFHVGSNSGNPKIYHRALSNARELFYLAKSVGYDFNFVNIGGGYLGERADSIDFYAKHINAALMEFFPDLNVKIISEPGTFFAATSGTLATNIHSLRTVKEHDNLGNISLHNMYYLNDGCYGSFNKYALHNFSYNVEPLHVSFINYIAFNEMKLIIILNLFYVQIINKL